MTQHHLPPEDTFDRWLDALLEGEPAPNGDETAAWLHDHFALPPVSDIRLSASERAAIRSRIVPAKGPAPGVARSAGIVSAPIPLPVPRRTGPWRVASLAAVALVVLIAAATLGAFLRTDDGERLPGAVATASVLPFAPGSALASPAAAACATDETLLLVPEPGTDTGAFADLPFPVAWYRDGVITVQDGDRVLRQIGIGEADFLRPTAVPGVVLTTVFTHDATDKRTTLVNLATGEAAVIGPHHDLTFSDGPYLFRASDGSLTRWSVTDLRTFETVDLADRFRVEPPVAWRPYSASLTTSADGTVVLASTTTNIIADRPLAPATPFPSDLPPMEITHHAILIDGSLNTIRLVGPLATTSGAMTLSPDGATVAWLAPDRAGQRKLVIEDVASGETILERTVGATYSNSLLFSTDGTVLHTTYGDVLESIPLRPGAATPTASATLALPDTAYRIIGASPDRMKLLLARTTTASGEISLWVDLASGEVRELEGTPGRMFTGQVPGVASTVNRYVLLDDIEDELRIVDMTSGEVALTTARVDTAVVTIAPDGATVAVPQEDGVEIQDLATGRSTVHLAPAGTERIPTTFALPTAGACAAGNWDLEGDRIETVLLPLDGGDPVPLPASAVGGWLPPPDP